MAEIHGFRGIRYNIKAISSLRNVVTPPYDVISDEQRDMYYERDQHNIIRLILGRETPGDNERYNKYTRAADFYRNWLDTGILIRDEQPSIYIYRQRYTLSDGVERSRTGFISLIRLEEFEKGVVLPHEKTLSGPKIDRLNLMRACHANFSQIFSLYHDQERELDSVFEAIMLGESPLISIEDDEAVGHQVWKVSDPSIISRVASFMESRKVYIADGHHRYETAINYRNEVRERQGEGSPLNAYNFTMMMFVNVYGEGLTVLPTHRMVHGLAGCSAGALLEQLNSDFNVRQVEYRVQSGEGVAQLVSDVETAGRSGTAFGFYAGDGKAYIAVLRDPGAMDRAVGASRSPSWKELDVSVLHTLVFEEILGMSEESQARKENLAYTRDPGEAVAAVDSGKAQAAFILNATRPEQVARVAEEGDKMPQKSTYFYPKLLTGLVINSLEGQIG